jgi:hypothetical protein
VTWIQLHRDSTAKVVEEWITAQDFHLFSSDQPNSPDPQPYQACIGGGAHQSTCWINTQRLQMSLNEPCKRQQQQLERKYSTVERTIGLGNISNMFSESSLVGYFAQRTENEAIYPIRWTEHFLENPYRQLDSAVHFLDDKKQVKKQKNNNEWH